METVADTFRGVTERGLDWVNARIPSGVAAVLIAPGATEGRAGIGLAPWRFDTPLRRLGAVPGEVSLSATARLAVWAWAADARDACDALDPLFFAAMVDPCWRLSETEPPAAFWGGSSPLSIILAATVSRRATEPGSGRVEHPLVFEIATRPERI